VKGFEKVEWNLSSQQDLGGIGWERIVFDPFSSLDGHAKLGEKSRFWEKVWETEEYLSEEASSSICLYHLSEMEEENLKRLVEIHDSHFLSTGDALITTPIFLERGVTSKKVTKKFVKNHLRLMVLSLVKKREEVHGKEVIEWVHQNFGVLLSPGRIYPLLNELAEEGLLTSTSIRRKKVYRISNEEASMREIREKVSGIMSLTSQMDRVAGSPGSGGGP